MHFVYGMEICTSFYWICCTEFQARVLVLKETYHVTNCAVPPQQPAETPIFPDDRGGGGRRRYEDPLASPCGTPLSCVVRREGYVPAVIRSGQTGIRVPTPRLHMQSAKLRVDRWPDRTEVRALF